MNCGEYEFEFFNVLCNFFVGLLASIWNWLIGLWPEQLPQD